MLWFIIWRYLLGIACYAKCQLNLTNRIYTSFLQAMFASMNISCSFMASSLGWAFIVDSFYGLGFAMKLLTREWKKKLMWLELG